MLLAKNFQNRSMFHGVIQKIKVAPVFLRHGVQQPGTGRRNVYSREVERSTFPSWWRYSGAPTVIRTDSSNLLPNVFPNSFLTSGYELHTIIQSVPRKIRYRPKHPQQNSNVDRLTAVKTTKTAQSSLFCIDNSTCSKLVYSFVNYWRLRT